MGKKNITVKILGALVFVDFLETFTNFCLKKSTFQVSNFHVTAPHDLLAFFHVVLFSPFLWFGLVSVAATFVLWSTILSKIDLSVAVPICSLSYITVPVVSIFFLHETITPLRWVGIFFILAGVITVSLSGTKETG